jgi:site-specific DNA-methyltransferase (adenine-specific)
VTLPAPYYADEHATLYCGDALELLPELGDGTADLVVTDPPYFRVVDAEWDDQWGADASAFLAWIGEVLDHARRVGTPRATLAVFASHDMACGVETELRRRFAFLNHVVWRKPGPGRLGQMNKDSLRRFFPTSERILIGEQLRNPDDDLFRFVDHVNHQVAAEVYAPIRERLAALRDAAGLRNVEVDKALGRNGMASHYFGASQWHLPHAEAWTVIAGLLEARGVTAPTYAEIRGEYDNLRREFDTRRREFDTHRDRRDLELLSDVWTFTPPHHKARYAGHPTQKPLALLEHLVGTLSRPGDTVVDPFAGTGTTLAAAVNLGRRAVGIEKEERYCAAIVERLAQRTLFGGEG